jgi:uncharacterized protein YqgV (UPF0045/DUF77 family)
MNISVELTLSPLKDAYEEQIIKFIKALRESSFTVLENPLSTQIYGDYDEVMSFLQQEMKEILMQEGPSLFYMKIVNSERSDYKPYF